jgi:F-type H+-transporting ATPase subunit epsilon
MEPTLMHLKVLLPYRVFADQQNVVRIITETVSGSFGLLPHRLDCAAALVPGILAYESAGESETYIAVDQGMLVKTGPEVLVATRNAIRGGNLGKLRAAVEREFLNLDEREREVRQVLAKLESRFVRRLMEFHRP